MTSKVFGWNLYMSLLLSYKSLFLVFIDFRMLEWDGKVSMQRKS